MRILVSRFCHGGWEHHAVGTFLKHAALEAHKDRRITFFNDAVANEFPTTVARNKIAFFTQKMKYDALFMIDNDNAPDVGFFTNAVNWLIQHPRGVIAAPYCGSRPLAPGEKDREVMVIIEGESGLRKVTREEAKTLTGIRPAVGLPTGVMAIGVPVFDAIKPPWFEYRYANENHTVLEMTEDYDFSWKCRDAGIEMACDWNCFAGHWKGEMIGRPE